MAPVVIDMLPVPAVPHGPVVLVEAADLAAKDWSFVVRVHVAALFPSLVGAPRRGSQGKKTHDDPGGNYANSNAHDPSPDDPFHLARTKT